MILKMRANEDFKTGFGLDFSKKVFQLNWLSLKAESWVEKFKKFISD